METTMEKFEQPQTINVELTAQQFNVVMASLQEIPFKVADPVIRELVKQVQGQLGAPPAN
jgi:hypothetical protein